MPNRPTPIKTDSAVEQIEGQAGGQQKAFKTFLSGTEKDDDTRQEVAKKFVKYYFMVLIGIIFLIPTYNYFMYRLTRSVDLLLPLKDIILTYSAVVGPTMGLVVAYYFKSKSE